MTLDEIRSKSPKGATHYRFGYFSDDILYYELKDSDYPLFIDKDGVKRISFSMDVLVELKPL